jgi:H+-transporting ATPase
LCPPTCGCATAQLLVDQSALTGESAAVQISEGKTAYAGALVRGGEATGIVTATGPHTFFGKTAELVRTAHAANRQEHEIVRVVRDLFVLNAGLMVIIFGVAHVRGLTLAYTLPLVLTILLASIPVALPATFTLAAALGSLELSKFGVLVTRLSALHDIASMTVLCTDKTGTLTRNEATLATLRPADGFSEEQLLRAAWLASDPAGHDPVDGAMVRAATARGLAGNGSTRVEFKPFDPATKRAEAAYREAAGVRRYTKGAPAVIAELCGVPESAWLPREQELAARGQRVLAVATGEDGKLRFAGLVGLEDAVRDDSRAVVQAIHDAGVRVVMVTGDNALTALAVAVQVGIPPQVCPPADLHGDLSDGALENSVFAGVFPEDKFKLVRAFQRQGAVVGMSGDGVNDAPALRQAEAGVAVANATDVAKAAAAIVLTRPGLADMVPAIEASRRVFQRIIAYTLNMLAKKIEMMLLLVIGFLLTGHRPLTPLLMVLIIFLNDFLTMSLTTDRMSVSARPNQWQTRAVVTASTVIALCKLIFSLGVFLLANYILGPGPGAPANADLRDADSDVSGGRVSIARAPPLLDLAAQPRNAREHALWLGRDGGDRAVGLARARRPPGAAWPALPSPRCCISWRWIGSRSGCSRVCACADPARQPVKISMNLIEVGKGRPCTPLNFFISWRVSGRSQIEVRKGERKSPAPMSLYETISVWEGLRLVQHLLSSSPSSTVGMVDLALIEFTVGKRIWSRSCRREHAVDRGEQPPGVHWLFQKRARTQPTGFGSYLGAPKGRYNDHRHFRIDLLNAVQEAHSVDN